MLSPASVQVPVPDLVRAPAPVPRILARLLAVLVPSSVSPKPEPVMVPVLDSTMCPLLALMVESLPSVSKPL